MALTDRDRLRELLERDAVLRGTFRLSSGATSDLYLDCRRVTLHPEGAVLVGTLLLDWLARSGLEVDAVGGPTLGADPMVASVVALSQLRERPLRGFLVRSAAKAHGTQRAVEGAWREGDRALVVEDTVSTGGSLLRALKATEEAAMRVAAVVCIVDREAGGQETLDGYRFESLFRASELGL